MQMVADGDPVQHVAVSAEQFQQRRLAGQDQFQGGVVVEGRTNQQAEIGEGWGLEQVGLIQQDQQRPLGLAGMVADLAQELVLAPEGRLPQVPDQQPQQVVAGELGQVHVAGLDAGPAEFVPEAFQESRFAHAAGAGQQTQRAGGGEVPQPGQALGQAVVGPETFGRRVLGEGLNVEAESVFPT